MVVGCSVYGVRYASSPHSIYNLSYGIEQCTVYMSLSYGVNIDVIVVVVVVLRQSFSQSLFSCCFRLRLLSLASSFPLGSFYPIKFIRSNIWIWHQRHIVNCTIYILDIWLCGFFYAVYFQCFFFLGCFLRDRMLGVCSHLNCWCFLPRMSFLQNFFSLYIVSFCFVLIWPDDMATMVYARWSFICI